MKNNWSKHLLILFVAIVCVNIAIGQTKTRKMDCSAKLEDDLLTLENSQISRVYDWNGGNLITKSITDKQSGKVWVMNTKKPDLSFPGESVKAENGTFNLREVPETAIAPKHLEVEIIYLLGKLEVKRIFRLYPNCPAIACDLYFRGESTNTWLQPGINLADMVNLEKLSGSNAGNNTPVIEKLELPGKHWQIKAIEFFDVTDRFNNLVRSVNAISYKPNYYRGNLLLANDVTSGNGLFILKEAPTSNVQLAYPGSDFITEYGSFRAVGVGINPVDLDPKEWKRGYGFVTGVYSGSKNEGLNALRNYQKNLRLLKTGRDEMVLMNTWGDRGQDTRVRESFAIAELETGSKLGITHFQLDDGWQTGRSSNSAFKGGSLEAIWNNPHYWDPNPEKFPNGLEPVVKKGKELGIEICLWFNPSRDNSNEHWEKDADALIGLYKKYGIRTFKIDGVNLPDKTAELNFRKFLDKVSQETNQQVVFNLDVTAGRRGGYHYFNEYGNLFLENRYTDWQNYYPYTTLRNLWMLSEYIPAEKLQIEFLNKWRNQDKYTNDPFGPMNYSFEYLFAITMAAQPLAWFEGTGLPAEAITTIGPVIRKYREIQSDLHSGNIFPIGDEPSGKSWTGFQSEQEGKGYFIIYREANNLPEMTIKTWLKEGTRIKCTPILGKGKAFSAKAGNDGAVTFELPEKNSYSLYQYSIILPGK
ncbi:MAG: alpha-galactosidase [Mariniphaga sp.]